MKAGSCVLTVMLLLVQVLELDLMTDVSHTLSGFQVRGGGFSPVTDADQTNQDH